MCSWVAREMPQRPNSSFSELGAHRAGMQCDSVHCAFLLRCTARCNRSVAAPPSRETQEMVPLNKRSLDIEVLSLVTV